MKQIPNAQRFPYRIKQTTDYFCIPASIEAVTKYFEPSSLVTQDYVWTAFRRVCSTLNLPLEINFKSIKQLVIDSDPQFAWAVSRHIDRDEVHSFDDVSSKVRDSINQGLPHIISVPVKFPNETRWHMLTAVGYDDFNLRVYDPNPYRQSPYDLPLTTLHADLQTLAGADITDSLVLRPKQNPPQVTNP